MAKVGLIIACSHGRGSRVDLPLTQLSRLTLVPVFGGATLLPLPEGWVGYQDNEGNATHWSKLNPFLNECTTFLWAGCNLERCGLDDVDYIGTAHYRRIMKFDTSRLGADVEAAGVWHRLRREPRWPQIRHPLPAVPRLTRPGQFRRFLALEHFINTADLAKQERDDLRTYFETTDMGFMRNMFFMPREVFTNEYIPFLKRFCPEALRIIGLDGRNPGYVLEQLAAYWFGRRFPHAERCHFLQGAEGDEPLTLYT